MSSWEVLDSCCYTEEGLIVKYLVKQCNAASLVEHGGTSKQPAGSTAISQWLKYPVQIKSKGTAGWRP